MLKNKHESDLARDIAIENTILRTQVGSGLHGVTVEAQDDIDHMGVAIEPPECVIGLQKFEQYQFRTQPEGVRSGPGDLDLTIYSLRKWARLAADGNPTVLLLLFAPATEWVTCTLEGLELQMAKRLFISKQCGRRFLGYLDSQKEKMLGLRHQRTNRPELIEQYGFDSKFAYHAVRLGIQGNELLSTGNITLPMPEPDRTWLRELRVGLHSKKDALDRIDDARAGLQSQIATCDLPDHPDYAALNYWLTNVYQAWWARPIGHLTFPL